MADVSKIKLPDDTTINIKDSRISGIDSTPTSGSNNVVTSGGVYTAIDLATQNLVSYPTFEIDDSMHLNMNSVDEDALSLFSLNSDGHLIMTV